MPSWYLWAIAAYGTLFALERAVGTLPGEGALPAIPTVAWGAVVLAGLLFAARLATGVLLAFETLVLFSLAVGVITPTRGAALMVFALTAARAATLLAMRRRLQVSALGV